MAVTQQKLPRKVVRFQIPMKLLRQILGFPERWTLTDFHYEIDTGVINIYISGPDFPAVKEDMPCPFLYAETHDQSVSFGIISRDEKGDVYEKYPPMWRADPTPILRVPAKETSDVPEEV